MKTDAIRCLDLGNFSQRQNNFWAPLIVRRAVIEQQIERLEAQAKPESGRRQLMFVHPESSEPGLGLAPGIDVCLNVLKPGEEVPITRHNANQISICIDGSGEASIGGKTIAFKKWGVWTTPAMKPFKISNTGNTLLSFFTYSNAPLLRKLEVYYSEDNLPESSLVDVEVNNKPRSKEHVPVITISEDGAGLMPYEHLIDPDFVVNRPLHWPFSVVERELEEIMNLGRDYDGRRLYLLYNPATERRNGTSHSFFASIAAYPPDLGDKPHRHTSSAINYYLSGNGRSVVMGKKYTWEQGDLMLSAPGWAVHAHASRDKGFFALTIQDHPLQIAMESLVWQELMESDIANLGAEKGFQTNIGDMGKKAEA